ncbi:MAG TPA: hypothetical protein VFL66_04505 [Gaiellaceae bacterium]|nr:hypothetical protein [Gaiellaceae bacterium]
MDAAGVLKETRRLIGAGWCRGSDARDASGRPVAPGDPAAAEWSLLGALGVVAAQSEVELEELATALAALAGVIADPSLSHWNDEPERTQSAVLETLVRAADELRDQRLTVRALSRN